MFSFGIHSEDKEEITSIIFAQNCFNYSTQAYYIKKGVYDPKYITICDERGYVEINSKEHALNLIKALNKAIELGWLE